MAELTAAEQAELKWSYRRVASWREALERAEPGVTYRCDDGTMITFGKQTVRFK